MIPSLVSRISKTLSFGQSSAQGTTNGTGAGQTSHDDGAVGTLRRQSTKQLVSEDEVDPTSKVTSKVTSRSSIRSSRSSSSVRGVSRAKSALSSSSKRTSKPPSRLVEQDEPSPSAFGTPNRTPSKKPSSIRTPSKQGSLVKMPSNSKQGSLRKAASLSKTGSVGKMAAPALAKTSRPGGKLIWFEAGAYLTVRNDEGGFYLCRAVNNIYNTTKSAKIRWLGPKTGRKRKRGARGGAATPVVDENAYELVYPDVLDPTTILMEVNVERQGTSFLLATEDEQETGRLLQVAEDVESGKMDKSTMGDDVEEAVLVEYEPPVKRRKLQSGESPARKSKGRKSSAKGEKKPRMKKTGEKKPRLKKTESQKARDKENRDLVRQQLRKEAADRRKCNKPPKVKKARTPKVKKAKKDDTTLHPNPDVKVMEKDPLWETNTHMPYVSKYSNARLAFRAVQLNDVKMLKKLLKDPETIHSLNYKRNTMVPETPMTFAFKHGSKAVRDLLVEEFCGSKFQKRLEESHEDRVLLGKLGTGSYNFRSLGVSRIRPLMASRGAREGNNALTKDEAGRANDYSDIDLVNYTLEGASLEVLADIMPEDSDRKDKPKAPDFTQNNHSWVRRLPTLLARGFNVIAGEALQSLQSYGACRGIPAFTGKILAAKDVAELPNIPPSAIIIQNKMLKGFTMIHIAASNPNPAILEKVLNSDPNFLVSDAKGMRPIHIAAGCTSTEVLQLLLDRGANPYDADSEGKTALHFAVEAGRTKNVKILLELSGSSFVDPTAGKSSGGINRANKKSYNALHTACLLGNRDIVELLIKHGANVEAKTSLNDLSVMPLMCAAGAGHLAIVRCLVAAGAVVEQSDRVGRTALLHAAMNGSTSVMSYLLNIGAGPNRKDTSGNTALHYAAAYGWYFSVKLLLESGADPAVSNDWATTPLSVAYLKGHQGIVGLLLEDERVDVNFPNQEGETLLFIACSSAMEQDLLEQIQYLVKDKGAKCDLVNNSGETPLHILAETDLYKADDYEEDGRTITRDHIINKEEDKVVLDIAKLMVESGCDLSVVDDEGYTAVMLALKQKNINLAKYLAEKGSPILTTLTSKGKGQKDKGKPSTLLHALASGVMGIEHGDPNSVITFLTKTLTVNGTKKSFNAQLEEMAQTFDNEGETPLLVACRKYGNHRIYTNLYLDVEYKRWECARTFMKNLIGVAKSDVNATNQPKWRPFDVSGEERNPQNRYKNAAQAQWTPVFYMVKTDDPFYDKQKKSDPEIRGTYLKYFLSLGAQVNLYDLYGKTPLIRALEFKKDVSILQILVKDGGADVNMCHKKSVEEDDKTVVYKIPPICLAAQLGRLDAVGKLVALKADVNAVDQQDQANVLLKLAVNNNMGSSASEWPNDDDGSGSDQSDGSESSQGGAQSKARSPDQALGRGTVLEQLLEAGVDPNASNKEQQTALHMLVSRNQGRINDSFDMEMLLIGKKADLAAVDHLGRTPLHIVFCKYTRWTDTSQCDPVDLCKLLVKSMRAADLNIRDDDGRAPLHYAARRGASICSMFLMQKGADRNLKDRFGNTPLSLAVQCEHDSCGSVLIQNGADLLSPVVWPKKTSNKAAEADDLPAEWKWKPLYVETKPEEDKKVPLYQEAIKQGLVGVSFLIMEWPVEKSGITLVDAIEMAVKNSQFNVAHRLLSTTLKGSAEVRAVRDKNRNLLHILALYADPSTDQHEQKKLVQTLLDKGVQADSKDKYNCTPVHYAVYNKNWSLANTFAGLPGVLNVKSVDCFNRNLVAAAVWRCFYNDSLPPKLWDWVEMLAKKKIDLNAKFDFPLPVDVFGSKMIREAGDSKVPEYWRAYPGQQTTLLIFMLHCKDFTLTHNLLQWGANPNLPDQRSLTPLIHAVKLNSVKHVKQLLRYTYDPEIDDVEPKKAPKKKAAKRPVKKNVFRLKKVAKADTSSDSASASEEEEEEEEEQTPKKPQGYLAIKKTSSVNLNATDKDGWTALHHVACPLDLGTYDNDELVFVLGKAGAKLDIKNSAGKTPLDLAMSSNAPKVAAMLQTLLAVHTKNQKLPITGTTFPRVNDGVTSGTDYDFHADAAQQLGGEEDAMEEDEAYEAPIDQNCKESGNIARDEEQDLPYEVLMTKCDARLGQWGLYNFYQIQLIHQPGQNLYVLFTRWGRIGDSGQFQHTPFQTKPDAVKEFSKIFKEKSGNKWEDVKSFDKKPRKYRLVPPEERRPPKAQKKIEFDFKTKVKPSLPDDVFSAINIMVSIDKLQTAYRRNDSIDTDILPFGCFSRERLLKAMELLEEMSPLVKSIAEYRRVSAQDKSQEEKDEHQQECEKVSALSSDYFQLIPQKQYVYEKMRPLDTPSDHRRQSKIIINLLDFEVSTKLMLGAMLRRTVVHPLDYIYRCMKCKLELMGQDDPVTQFILRYAAATSKKSYNGSRPRLEGVYRVEREGEEERFLNSGVGNRRLLWHGTGIGNMVSILNRGLVATPLDAQKHGDAFGKGIYFSDMFEKSDGYSSVDSKSSGFMLLCEVALGKQEKVGREEDPDAAKPKEPVVYNSRHAEGQTLPDPNYDVLLPTGETIPLGDKVYEPYCDLPGGGRGYKPVSHSEFVVSHENQVCIRYLLQYRS